MGKALFAMTSVLGLGGAVAVGCGGSTGDEPSEAQAVEVDGLDESYLMNSPDGWSVDPKTPVPFALTQTVFKNNSGSASNHRGGSCIVQRVSTTLCANDAACQVAGQDYRYCVKPILTQSNKYCYKVVSSDPSWCERGKLLPPSGTLASGATHSIWVDGSYYSGGAYYNLAVLATGTGCYDSNGIPQNCLGCKTDPENPAQCTRALSSAVIVK